MRVFLARAGLDLLFAGNGGSHLVEDIVPDEHLAAVAGGAAGYHCFSMLIGALRQLRCDDGIERSIAPICHDVDSRLFLVPLEALSASEAKPPAYPATWIAATLLATTRRSRLPHT